MIIFYMINFFLFSKSNLFELKKNINNKYRLYFDENEFELTEKHIQILNEFIKKYKEAIKNNNYHRLVIKGYDSYKDENSIIKQNIDNRLIAIYNYLIKNTIEPNKIKLINYNENLLNEEFNEEEEEADNSVCLLMLKTIETSIIVI